MAPRPSLSPPGPLSAVHAAPARWLATAVIALLAIAVWGAPTASAQERPQPSVDVAAGVLVFADDGAPTEPFVGAAMRVYISPRISLGPEVAAIRGERHHHYMLTGNLTVDLRAPAQRGAVAGVTPFVVIGGGVFSTHERFGNTSYASSDPAFTAGGGIRVRAGRRVTLGAEVRIGWELHVRTNALVGIGL